MEFVTFAHQSKSESNIDLPFSVLRSIAQQVFPFLHGSLQNLYFYIQIRVGLILVQDFWQFELSEPCPFVPGYSKYLIAVIPRMFAEQSHRPILTQEHNQSFLPVQEIYYLVLTSWQVKGVLMLIASILHQF